MSAEVELIDKYVDRAGFASDTKFVLDELNSVQKKFMQVESMKVKLEFTGNTKELLEQVKKLSEAQTALSKSTDKLLATQKQQAESEGKLAKAAKDNADAKLKEAKAETELAKAASLKAKASENAEKIQRREKKIAEEISNDYLQLSRAYSEAALKAKNYVLTLGENHPITVQAVKDAKDLSDTLKRIDSSVGQNQRNVGNYANSLADGFELVRREVSRLQKEQDNLAKGGDTRGAEATARRISQLNDVIKISYNSTNTFDQSVKGLQKSFSNLAADGGHANEFLNEFKKFVAGAKDQADDLKAEIKALSSDTRKLDLVISGISTLTATAQAAVGANELFGESSEDVQKSIQKLVAIQTVANGVQQIGKDLTDKGTAANKLYAYTQTLVSTAMDKTATSGARLSAVLKLSLFALVAGAIAYLVVKMKEWGKEADTTSRTQKALNDVSKAAADSYGKELAKLDLLIAAIKTEGATRKEKFDTLKKLQAEYPGYFDNIKTEADLNEKLALAYDKTAIAILASAKAKAAENRIGENSSKLLQLELDYQNSSVEFEKSYQKRLQNERKIGRFDEKQFVVDAVKYREKRKIEFENEKAEIQKENDALVKVALAGQDLINKGGGKDKNDIQKSAKEESDARLKTQFEILKLEKERRIDFDKSVVDDEKSSLRDRLLLLEDYAIQRKLLIEGQANLEIKTGTKTKKELELIEEQRKDSLIRLAQETSKKLEEIITKSADVQVKSQQPVVEGMTKSWADAITKIKAEWDKYRKDELEKEKNYVAKRKELTEKLVEEMKDLVFDLFTADIERQKNAIGEQINMLDEQKQKEIDTINQTVTNKEKAAAEIAIIEARAAAQKEKLQRRQKQLDIEKARFDRAQNIANIIQSTAAAIIKALAEFPGPKGIALSILAGAIGAVQLTRAVSTPIPKYKHGKSENDSYAGPAIVGDGGRSEMIIREDGSLEITPAKPTLAYINKKDLILPDASAFLKSNSAKEISGFMFGSTPSQVFDDTNITAAIEKNTSAVVKAIRKIPPVRIKTMTPMQQWMKSNLSIDQWRKLNS